mmetsp:Transcript_28152/g.39812  ORF Transcript_28152/g.39812 Transcript_28152/m.39812 type:complete len:230 (-) Transcript_28152:28-717(-)
MSRRIKKKQTATTKTAMRFLSLIVMTMAILLDSPQKVSAFSLFESHHLPFSSSTITTTTTRVIPFRSISRLAPGEQRQQQQLSHSEKSFLLRFSLLHHLSSTCLSMTMASDDGNTDYSSNSNDHDHNGDPSEQNNHPNQNNTSSFDDDQILDVFESRITQLEQIVARQEVELQKLRKECNDLTEASFAFARVVELLRQAAGEKGITSDALSPLGPAALLAKQKKTGRSQ